MYSMSIRLLNINMIFSLLLIINYQIIKEANKIQLDIIYRVELYVKQMLLNHCLFQMSLMLNIVLIVTTASSIN